MRELKAANKDLMNQNKRLENAFEDIHNKDFLNENKKLKLNLKDMTLMYNELKDEISKRDKRSKSKYKNNPKSDSNELISMCKFEISQLKAENTTLGSELNIIKVSYNSMLDKLKNTSTQQSN